MCQNLRRAYYSFRGEINLAALDTGDLRACKTAVYLFPITVMRWIMGAHVILDYSLVPSRTCAGVAN